MSKKQDFNQRTLFQTWNKEPGSRRAKSSFKDRGGSSQSFNATEAAKMVTSQSAVIDLSDDELLEAAELLESTINSKQEPSFGSNKGIENLPGFDNSLGNLWIYPTNYPVREYQFSIVRNALTKNTLVSLPTGLGKTFIAAVVMYNFYRWYPQGKIIFMAPTKPLVSQQIEACYKIMGIPLEDQAEITGMTTSVYKREALWSSKRVFFLTPQVINNDLARGVCPGEQIKCVVIDEAHKAQGKHSYCQVINQLVSLSRNFRVLALSATPGTDVKSVQQVLTNLLISNIEIRSEDSIDIQGFSHQRKVEKVVCKLDETMVSMRDNYLKVIEIFTKSLVHRRALFERETSSYSKYGILMARDQFRRDPPSGLNKYEVGAIEGDFATCISLLHGLELLQQHGMRSFFIFIKAMMEGDKGNMKAKSVLGANSTFREMYENLTNMFGSSPNPTVLLTQAGQTQQSMQKARSSAQSSGYVYSHPKIAKLEEVVLNHFRSFTQSHMDDATRVMVFCQYRDSVQEITELLQMHRPLVRPMQFVGHSTASGKIAKFTQKDQLQVVSKFRAGGYNTLISTCVGEEGLDIGDVDLIVCFDAHKSPIRLVQRMGRTGRKRKGRIVMLVTEGKEERDYNFSLSNRKSIQKAITGNSSRALKFYEHNPRMIPVGLNPKPLKMHITVKERNETAKKPCKKKARITDAADISVALKKAEVRQPAFLNPEQVKEWDEKMKLSGKEKEQLKTLHPVGSMLCLGDRIVDSCDRPQLSLSEWTLWQTRLQDSKCSGHSTTTRNFVELMEICDLVKQSDDRDFEENLAPYLGGKYDRSSMESVKKKSKLDRYLTPVAKSTKNGKSNESVKTAKEEDYSPQNLSFDDDFVLEQPKKAFLGKNGFKDKLHLFAADAVDEPGEHRNDDDTLNGIESILVDDQPSALKSERKQVHKNKTSLSAQVSPEEVDLQNLPNFDLGGWDIDDSPQAECSNPTENKKTSREPELKIAELVQGDETREGNNLGVIAKGPTSKECDPLLDFVNKLSEVPTETPFNLRGSGVDDKKSLETPNPNTPPSMNSISLDFMDHFASDVSDIEESANKTASKKKRACFSLGSCKDDMPEVGKRESLRGHSEYNTSATCSKSHPVNRKEDLAGQKEFKGLFEANAIGHAGDVHNQIKADDHVNADPSGRVLPKQHSCDDGAVDDLTIRAVAEGKQTTSTSVVGDVSADMFAPQFDVDFDFGEFDDEDDFFDEPVQKEELKLASPVLACKVKKCSSVGSNSSNSGFPNGSKCEISLASHTLSQRAENEAFFADRRKMQSTDEVPVAKVRPQNALQTSSDKSQRASPHVRKLESLKRRREVGEVGSIPSKRMKDSLFASPVTSVNSILSSKETDEKSVIFEDSPLIKKKKPFQSKKLLWSPDTSCSQHSSVSEKQELQPSTRVSKVTSKHATKHPLPFDDGDSPIIRGKMALKSQSHKHSTPKYQGKRKISTDSSEDDDFEIMVKPSSNIQRKTLTKPLNRGKKGVFRGRMKDFLNDEAEVTDDGVEVSSDEDEHIDPQDLEELKAFVNDATMLTQHVTDGSAIDEQAMYLQRKADFFEEEGQFQGHNGKFKLAYGVGDDLDVFSQNVPSDVSGYEEDSFVCDGDEEGGDNMTALGEVTLLQETLASGGSRKRVTRRQAELDKLRKLNRQDISPAMDAANRIQNKRAEKDRAPRKRIVCFDESTDSFEDSHKSICSKALDTTLSKSGSWSCPVCTLINKQSSQICELCDCERPDTETETRPASFQTWTCTLCTYINRSKSDVCDMCGEPNKEIPSSIKVFKSLAKCSNTSVCDESKDQKDKAIERMQNHVSGSCSGMDTIPATPLAVSRSLEVKKRLRLSPAKPPAVSKTESSVCSQAESSFSSICSEDREARLKKCKQKQLEFKARMEKRRSGQSSLVEKEKMAAATNSKSSSILPSAKASLMFTSPVQSSSDFINSSLVDPVIGESVDSDNVILVDSKELSSSQAIITTLRCNHNTHVTVASLPHCDYIVGRGTAVERKMVSDLSQAADRQKLATRIQHLNLHYDRIYLIVEQDRLKKKGFAQEGRNSHNSCYVSTLCSLAVTNIRILYSNNQEDTANILVMLCTREKCLNRGIDVAAAKKANDAKCRSLLRIYSSIPKVSFVSSLYMCLNFKSFKEVASSSVEKLIQKAHMTTSSAAEVYNFFRRHFDLQMTPSR